MAWTRPPASLIALFKDALPLDPRIEPRTMFGCPCAFVSGNMFTGVHEDNVVFRLDEAGRAAAGRAIRAKPFMPGGRPMREYVAVAEADLDPKRLADWIGKSLAYAETLPAKAKKARKASAAKPKSAGRHRRA